jgi:hypothetical protein
MAHFAQLDSNNIVTQVIVLRNDDAPTEEAGQAFIASLGLAGVWKQTSYNTYRKYEAVWSDDEPRYELSRTYVGSLHSNGGTPFRGQYAGIGDRYDAELDEFITPDTEVAE